MRILLPAALASSVAACLLAGIAGGLLRVGIVLAPATAAWLPRAALGHAVLMIGGFMGTVIGVERAVAARRPAAWSAPLLSGVAGIAWLAGAPAVSAALFVLASLCFAAVNGALLRRQPAAHTVLLLAGALGWCTGNVLLAAGAAAAAVLPWWFLFLLVTVAAERLEMTRLARRRPGAQATLFLLLVALAGGAALSAVRPAAGGLVYGAALGGVAAWLLAFDIARRTVRAHGLARYMAVCLLAGYAWLAIAGAAWAATALGLPARDIALHALGLGFLVSMIMGHAPVILPALTRVKLLFGAWFYVPLAALHLSLVLRLAGGFASFHWRAQGALFNTLAIAVFGATAAGAALAWRRRHGAAHRGRPHTA